MPDYNIILSWIRRARINAALVDSSEIPLDVPVEKYKVIIYTSNTYTTAVRTVTVTATTSMTYSNAQIIADFAAIPAILYFSVTQLTTINACVTEGYTAYGNFVTQNNPASEGPPHPDILLWVPFTDATATDISQYNRTPTITIVDSAATVITDYFHINKTSASPTSFETRIEYPIAPSPWTTSTGIPNTVPLTFEGFIKWSASAFNTIPFHIFRFDPRAPTTDVRRFQGYGELGDIQFNDGVNVGPTVSHPLAPAGTEYHWAWVIPAYSDLTNRIYINGIEIFNFSRARSSPTALETNGVFVIGGQTATNGGAVHHTEIYLGETRVVARNLYPGGTSFTPPTPGNLMDIV